MAYQSLGIGSAADDGTGDSLRVGGDKINDNFKIIQGLGNIDNIDIIQKQDEIIENSFTGILGNIKISVPIDGLIDIEEEKLRLKRKIDKLNQEILKRDSKMKNKRFLLRQKTG